MRDTVPLAAPYRDFLEKATRKEKIALCEGADFWHTLALPAHGIPAVMMCDGPHGLRKQMAQADMMGVNDSLPATCFPTAAATGCSWDPELVGEIGRAVCEEARAAGVSLVLGPGLNVKRNPLCGRNFEYFSEDPLLSGKLAAAYVRTGQETGVGCCLKHFAGNSQEYKRFSSDSIMDARTFREIYLTGFELAVKEGRPRAVMCSYNKNNGVHASDDKTLLTDILRTEWGFGGMVVTDWGAMNDRVAAFQAGCDLNMPGGSRYQQTKAVRAVADGTLDEADIDRSVARILAFVHEAQQVGERPCDMAAHHDLARRAAEESAVLLKNDGALPIRGSACLIGHMAKAMRYQGAGSSHIHPARLVHPADCLDWPFSAGCLADGSTTDAMLQDAARLAKTVETPVVVVGLTDLDESEGFDRAHMRMPQGHIRLIETVAEANPNTVVVLLAGGVVETPWLDRVNALLYMALPGEAGGEAMARLLAGEANPGGKLAETWPLVYDDVPTRDFYGARDAEYREGIYVGYRYYDSANRKVRFPFGFGLSYTSFSYADLQTEGRCVRVTVTNTGALPGAEVVQLYLRPPEGGWVRPARELKGFQKLRLQPGERKMVTFDLSERSFAIWDDGWKVPAGTYVAEVGGLTANMAVAGVSTEPPAWRAGSWYETFAGTPSREGWERMLGRKVACTVPAKGAFTMDNTLLEMKASSLVMRCMYTAVEATIARRFGGHRDETNPTYRMLLTSSADSALRNMAICGGMRESLFEGLLEMANGHFLRGIVRMVRG